MQHEEQHGPGEAAQQQQKADPASGKSRPGNAVPGAVAVKAEPMADTDGQAQGLDGQLGGPSHAEDGAPLLLPVHCKQSLLELIVSKMQAPVLKLDV